MPSYSIKSFLLYLNSGIFWCSPMNYIKQSPSFIFLAGILQEPVVMFSLFLWICLFDLKAAKVLKHSNYFCFSIKYSVSPQKILFASSQQKKLIKTQLCSMQRLCVLAAGWLAALVCQSWGASHCAGLSMLVQDRLWHSQTVGHSAWWLARRPACGNGCLHQKAAISVLL